jgi:hypothetical protein
MRAISPPRDGYRIVVRGDDATVRSAGVMTLVSQAEFQAALRVDFYSFMLRCFAELNPGAAFLPSWHIELMAAKLQAVRDRRIRRLIINIPPRHLKSLAASIALPAGC